MILLIILENLEIYKEKYYTYRLEYHLTSFFLYGNYFVFDNHIQEYQPNADKNLFKSGDEPLWQFNISLKYNKNQEKH